MLTDTGNCDWHVFGPFGGQDQALAAHVCSEPGHHGCSLTWHGSRSRTMHQPRCFAPSAVMRAQVGGKSWKGWVCQRVPGACGGMARAETTTPPWSLQLLPRYKQGRWITLFLPPVPPLFYPPRGHLQPGGSVPPRTRDMGKGRSVTLSPVMPGSPLWLLSAGWTQPRGCSGRSEAVHGRPAVLRCWRRWEAWYGQGGSVGREVRATAGRRRLDRHVKGHPPLANHFLETPA